MYELGHFPADMTISTLFLLANQSINMNVDNFPSQSLVPVYNSAEAVFVFALISEVSLMLCDVGRFVGKVLAPRCSQFSSHF